MRPAIEGIWHGIAPDKICAMVNYGTLITIRTAYPGIFFCRLRRTQQDGVSWLDVRYAASRPNSVLVSTSGLILINRQQHFLNALERFALRQHLVQPIARFRRTMADADQGLIRVFENSAVGGRTGGRRPARMPDPAPASGRTSSPCAAAWPRSAPPWRGRRPATSSAISCPAAEWRRRCRGSAASEP